MSKKDHQKKEEREQKEMRSRELNERIRMQNQRNAETISQNPEKVMMKRSKRNINLDNQSTIHRPKEQTRKKERKRDISHVKEIFRLKKQMQLDLSDEETYNNNDLRSVNTSKVVKTQMAEQQQS